MRTLVLGIAISTASLPSAVCAQDTASRWEAMKKRNRQLTAEALAQDPRRPVLRGAAVPGNAWEDYRKAVDEVVELEKKNLEVFKGMCKPDGRVFEKFLDDHPTVIEQISRGAQREKALHGYDWQLGLAIRTIRLTTPHIIADMTFCKSRRLQEGARHREAAELLLDLAQFGRDLAHNAPVIPEMLGAGVIGRSLEELRTLLASRKLSRDELASLAAQLQVLDASMSTIGRAMINERLMSGVTFEQRYPKDTTREQIEDGFDGFDKMENFEEYGFSLHRVSAEAFELMDDWYGRVVASDARQWSEALVALREIEREMATTKNGLVKVTSLNVTTRSKNLRYVRAKVRLLAAGAHFQATGKVLDLPDPFGGRLLHVVDGNKLKVWSVGEDGVDDRGHGTGWADKLAKDLVWEVERAAEVRDRADGEPPERR